MRIYSGDMEAFNEPRSAGEGSYLKKDGSLGVTVCLDLCGYSNCDAGYPKNIPVVEKKNFDKTI